MCINITIPGDTNIEHPEVCQVKLVGNSSSNGTLLTVVILDDDGK